MTSISIPAMPNAHSHAFQIGLRGAAERPVPAAMRHDDFWSWRNEMFALADHLDPTSIREISTRAFSDMRAAGYGSVGEFHYVHHRPDGSPYDDPNELAIAVAESAVSAGIEIVMLPAAYNRNGWDGADRPPESGQQRFCDHELDVFLTRVDGLREWAVDKIGVSVGVAAHSVRAVPAPWLEGIAAYAADHELPLHIHASEQRRELAECEAEHGCSPIELLDRTGFLSPRTGVVHAIHVSDADLSLLASSGATVVGCPTTEGSLGDGFPPSARYRELGIPVAVGSDSQVRIDPFEECREYETLARRASESRFGPLEESGDLWREMVENGRRILGLDLESPPMIELDLQAPDLLGVAEKDLELAVATCASASVVASPAPPPE
ncbi:MAG: formimidoylglutamate deiminase [Myxococcota bacterium]